MRKSTNSALAALKPSRIRRINALAASTPGCIALALGEPDFDTPVPIREAAKTALDEGFTHYPPNNGTPELRQAIAAYMADPATGDPALSYAPDEIIVTVGAAEALHATFAALLNPGDEVVIPTPTFALVENVVAAHHAVPVYLDTTQDAFQIDEARLRSAVTPATKAIIINSPNNPTGVVLTPASLDAVAAVAAETGIYVVCDDVYNRLVYTDAYERFAVRHAELREQIVVVDSFSKPWAMTGWRLGWLAAAAPVEAEIAKMHQYMVSSASGPEMPAGVCALATDPEPMLEVYRVRRERVIAALGQMGLPTVEPEGAFYAFPQVGVTGLSSDEFCERAIREAGVALVPSTCFGTEGYARLSYCVADDDLDEGLRRLQAFMEGLA